MSKPRRKSDPHGKSSRSLARTAAVQALYQMDMAGTSLNDVIDEFSSHALEQGRTEDEGEDEITTLEGADETFFAEILRGVVRRQRDIDPMVDAALATGWRLVRVDSILRAILRAGALELMERHDVPARVVINEYINVAHAFFAEDEPRVVNGILDRLAHQLRPSEFEAKGEGTGGGDA
jgi:transcription antitermination protein NusB